MEVVTLIGVYRPKWSISGTLRNANFTGKQIIYIYIYKYILYIYIQKETRERPTQGSYFSRANPSGTVFPPCRFAVYCGVAKRSQLWPRAPRTSAATPGVAAGSLWKAEPGLNTLLCFPSSAFPYLFSSLRGGWGSWYRAQVWQAAWLTLFQVLNTRRGWKF